MQLFKSKHQLIVCHSDVTDQVLQLTMHSLVNRRRRFKSLLESLCHPQSRTVFAEGKAVLLPLQIPFRTPSLEGNSSKDIRDYEKLAYGFSVFGFVTPYKCNSGISIYVSTRLSRAAIPVDFCNAFGGGVYLERGRRGTDIPRVSWKVSGKKAVQVCNFLSMLGYKTRKQKLLEIGASWPITRQDRILAGNQIRNLSCQLRKTFFETGKVENWKNFVELFDKRGHFTVSQGKHLRIVVCHLNTDLLRSIPSFLEDQEIGSFSQQKTIQGKRTSSYWSCQKRDLIRTITLKLLESGLAFQRFRAEAVLRLLDETEDNRLKQLTPARRRILMNALPDETNTMKYRRGSVEECIISELLLRLSYQMAWLRNQGGVTHKYLKIQELHASIRKLQKKMKLQAVVKELKEDVRTLLQQQ